jgi:hypothetical protein
MIAGHFFLAFSAASLAAFFWGYEGEKALKIGAAAGLFAVLPDIDIIYAFKELIEITSGFYTFSDSFWDASRQTHRGLTHSLLVSLISVAGFSSYYMTRNRVLAAVFVFVVSSAAFLLDGAISAIVMMAFLFTGMIITQKLRDSFDFKEFIAVSTTGLLTHPFGDVFTGVPPDFLYPLPLNIFESRVVFFGDASLNFLTVFGLELFFIWSAILAYIYMMDKKMLEELTMLSALGLIYGFSSFLISSPSLSTSYTFVFSILAFSILVTALIWVFAESRDRKFFYAFFDFFSIMSFSYLSYLIMSLIV